MGGSASQPAPSGKWDDGSVVHEKHRHIPPTIPHHDPQKYKKSVSQEQDAQATPNESADEEESALHAITSDSVQVDPVRDIHKHTIAKPVGERNPLWHELYNSGDVVDIREWDVNEIPEDLREEYKARQREFKEMSARARHRWMELRMGYQEKRLHKAAEVYCYDETRAFTKCCQGKMSYWPCKDLQYKMNRCKNYFVSNYDKDPNIMLRARPISLSKDMKEKMGDEIRAQLLEEKTLQQHQQRLHDAGQELLLKEEWPAGEHPPVNMQTIADHYRLAANVGGTVNMLSLPFPPLALREAHDNARRLAKLRSQLEESSEES